MKSKKEERQCIICTVSLRKDWKKNICGYCEFKIRKKKISSSAIYNRYIKK